MRSLINWFRGVLSDVTAKVLAALLAGFLLATFAGINAYGISDFLLQDVRAPVALVLVLSLFASIGILAGAIPLWNRVARSRRLAPDDEEDRAIQLALNQLLPRLTQIEAGKQLHMENEVREYKATTLALFDAWQMAVARFATKPEAASLNAMRDGINSQSLNQARSQATQWASEVRQITTRVRALRS